MNHKWRVYINPFDDFGEYTGYVEVTEDVIFTSLGSINQDLDNTQYDIGVFRVSNFTMQLRNNHGLYSDVGEPETLFRYKRSNSLVKVTWEVEIDGPYTGLAESESGYLSEETTMFIGFINDESSTMDLKDAKLSFTCVGRESLFQRAIVPFGSINNGDLFSEVLYAILNQAEITDHLTVLQANITCDTDLTIDSIASLQNQTVQEGLNKLLLASNSVLYIQNDTIYVSPRTVGADLVFSFYGQGSSNGIENIIGISDIKSGLNRVFNFVTWADTALFSEDATSSTKYGIRKKEVSFDFITDNTKRTSILDGLRDEFRNPKREFNIVTPLTYESLEVTLLDKVSIDYPTIYLPSPGIEFPICGVAICGESVLPRGLWAFSVLSTDEFKVIGKAIDINNAQLRFRVRMV